MSHLAQGRSVRCAARLLWVALFVVLLAACGGNSADPPARAGDLYQVDGETAHLQCQGAGSPTLVFLGGQGFTTTTWAGIRAALGPDVRTCAWDYPGVGHSTGAPMMTAARAAGSLDGTLRAADVPRPVMLVGHSIAGLTTRLFLGEHPADVAGVVLFDPTVASFARMFDDKEFRPGWDGTGRRAHTRWSRSPHGPTSRSRSSATIPPSTPLARCGTPPWKPDGVPSRPRSPRSPRGAPSRSCGALVTTSTKMPQLFRSLPSGGCWTT